MGHNVAMEKIWHKSYQPGVPSVIDSNQFGSLVDLLENTFQRFATRPAFHNMGKTLSYAEIDRLSYRFACFLQNDLKLSRGDRVAIMMPNILQYPVALFGVLRAGMVAVNCNPLYTPRELEHQLRDSGAKAIVIVANFAHVLEKAIEKTEVKHVVISELGDLLSFPKRLLVNAVVKHVKKMVPDYRIAGSWSFLGALAAGSTTTLSKPMDAEQADGPERRSGFLAIYRRDDGCFQRSDADPRQHRRKFLASQGLDSVPGQRGRGNHHHAVAALSYFLAHRELHDFLLGRRAECFDHQSA
jgi:acyl-CoA synthetase (AMP-forming)/AMP-acid ligase II